MKYTHLPTMMLILLLSIPSLQGAIHFTLKGTLSDNHYALKSEAKHATSASIAFDLGRYFRLGLTHRQGIDSSKGYHLNTDETSYYYREDATKNTSNSIDLSIILYYGVIFVPYIQAGVVRKLYVISRTSADSTPVTYSLPPSFQPNGGFGLGIKLNRNFSLKLSYTFSPAVSQARPEQEAEQAYDTYSSFGISYTL